MVIIWSFLVITAVNCIKPKEPARKITEELNQSVDYSEHSSAISTF